jgi:BirA family biotin operon repressor/biotin-[acetyl-CoA-carboxylase] ligase
MSKRGTEEARPSVAPPLDPAAIRKGLRSRLIGREVIVRQAVPSTNDIALELAEAGADEGLAVFAEEQTAGRGRLGRTWWSPRGGGLWLSILLRPRSDGGVPIVTIVGALGVADAIRSETGLPAMIRWPNDVLVDGRKVSGVLVEARQRAGGPALVLGIGLDVGVARAAMPPELANVAVSLSDALGRPVDRVAMARSLLAALDRWYRIALDGDLAAINDRWRELSATLGETITLCEHARTYHGTVIDVDVRLGLALRLDRGAVRHFRGEHVSLVHDAG